MTTEPGFREPAARPPALAWLLLAVLPVIVNGFLGYAYVGGLRNSSLPGLSFFVFAVPGLGLVLVAMLVGVAGIARRDAYGGMLARRWFAVAVLLAVGFGAGAAIIPVREALNPPPVVVELPPKVGAITLVLADPTWMASADPQTVGECPLAPSGDVRFVSHEQLGTLHAKPLSATFDLGDRASGDGEAPLSLVVFAGAALAHPIRARPRGGLGRRLHHVARYGFDHRDRRRWDHGSSHVRRPACHRRTAVELAEKPLGRDHVDLLVIGHRLGFGSP